MAQSFLLGKKAPELMAKECLPTLLAPSFLLYSNKIAYIFNSHQITYAELDNWSNAIAQQLHHIGVVKGDAIGVWYPRSLELPVIILGILKTGAAYIPLDREMPQDRIKQVFADIHVKTYFSDADANIHCQPILPLPLPQENVTSLSISIEPNHWAYVLFTSGSTGNPKGIPISHQNICHLVRSEQEVIQIRNTDIVYQGFSVSFDMWCEENWISLFAGATIWMADSTTTKAIDELTDVLINNKITVLHAVPSILAIIDEVPTIRLVNSGGEACTIPVLNKWGKAYRQFINSYGPTETTVTSNMAFLTEGDQLTIGEPLPNYNIAVVDENMHIVPRGEKGEMIITGPGVSNGYFNLPELTNQKFVPNTLSLVLPGDTIYKTGDAVIIHENGFIEFQGRFDDQIKLRGFRIELGEIEHRLNRIEGVVAAAVTVKEDANAMEQLVGYVIMQQGFLFDEDRIRKELASFLTSYMIPVAIVEIKEMPRMPSGKVNKRALPTPSLFLQTKVDDTNTAITDDDSVEVRLLKVLHLVFPGKAIQLSEDFFTDLGGHSLLAATLVSYLRQKAGLPKASLKEVYENRPLSAFAEVLKAKAIIETEKFKEPFHRVSTVQYYLCNLAQTISLLFIYGLLAIQIFFPYLSYYYFRVNEFGALNAVISAILLYILIPPIFTVLVLFAKRVIVGKLREGDYPLWGWYYFRWWLWSTMKRMLPSQFMVDTPLYPRYLRMLGVKVKGSAQLSLLSIGAEDLVTIDENVSTSSGCSIDNASVENGILKLRKVHLKAHAYLGSSSVVGGDTIVEEYGELQDLSCLQSGQKIGYAEVWNGSPAIKIKTVDSKDLQQPEYVSTFKRNWYMFRYVCTLFVFPLIVVIPLIPTLYTLYYLDDNSGSYDFTYLWQAPILALLYLIIFIFIVSGISQLLTIGLKPGTYSIYSFTYYQKWMKDQLMNMSLIVLHPLYATIFIGSYYRLLGAKVGQNAEISTASDVSHHLLEIGEGSFVADAVILGEHEVRNQKITLERTVIGNNSFIGNSGLIPQGYHLDNNMLIGVLSKAPTVEQLKQSKEKDWFGSPPIGLPTRQKDTNFDNSLTYNPTFYKKVARGIVELIRIIFPQTVIIISSVIFVAYAHDLLAASFGELLLLTSLYYLAIMAFPAFLITVICKWLLIGKYQKTAMPMYSLKVWLSEAITCIYEALAVPFLLDPLRGTMWLPILLRLLGLKAGKRTWLNTTDITEHDMVTIDDEAMLNEDCGPQTHLFEDRIMKIGEVHIGKRSTIGSKSIILYDSSIGDDVKIDSLSLLMKGEVLPNNSSWAGSPVKPI